MRNGFFASLKFSKKGGKTYVNHVIADKRNGKRRLRYASD